METEKAKRGFALMSPERRREIAAKGGAAIKPENRPYSKDRGLAISAGIKGNKRSLEVRRAKRDAREANSTSTANAAKQQTLT